MHRGHQGMIDGDFVSLKTFVVFLFPIFREQVMLHLTLFHWLGVFREGMDENPRCGHV